jgi:hypothetical protein
MPRIVALCGLMRSGKDTVANYLRDSHKYENVKLAGALKAMLQVMFNFDQDQLEGDKKDEVDPYWNITPRRAMQFFGTEVMQYKVRELLPQYDRTFWVAATAKTIAARLKEDPNGLFVISDMRFIHEHRYLKAIYPDMVTIKIERPSQESDAHSHESEKEFKLIKEDILITNDGTLGTLHKNIDLALSTIE